jgi:NAD(P)-dependent dehydrogenase (short-subunit alcohol dehydrogenase family)
LRLAQAGAKVVVSDLNVAGGEETAQKSKGAGGEAIFIEADVSQAAEVEALMAAVITAFGRLDLAVNNAGVGGTLTYTDRRGEDEWDAIMNVNLKGVWLCMKYEIPHLLDAGGGSIVNIASAAGLVGFRYGSAYAASKHGVVGLTRSAALEYARKNIRVNAVCPGFTWTPMVEALGETNPKMLQATIGAIPMKRLGKPEEIAETVLWLCSDESSFVTGHALAVDGGTVVG